MIKVILFDADGVLISGTRFATYIEDKYGVNHTQTSSYFDSEFLHCLTGRADLKKTITPHLEAWGINKSADEIIQEWYEFEHRVDDQLISHIQKLREQGISCIVATNLEKYRAAHLMRDLNFDESFDALCSSAQIGHTKQTINFFANIHSDLRNIHRSEILFFDDKKSHVESARQYGIHAEVYTDFEHFLKTLSEYGLQS